MPRKLVVLIAAAGALVAVLAIALLAAGWYFSGQLEVQALAVIRSEDRLDLLAEPAGSDAVRLQPGPGESPGGSWRQPGVYGLEWKDGYGQIAEIREAGDGYVIRVFHAIEGTLPTSAFAARADGFAYPGDPLRASALPFEDVRIAEPLGEAPAWLVDAPGDAWAIATHGQNANRREFLRMIPALHDAGLKVLVITYRNDEGAPAAPDHRLHYGQTEWRDLEAAVRYAQEHGAKRIVLMGTSMGGGITLSFLYRSELAPAVSAVILDAPMLDFETTVNFRAPGYVPGIVVAAGRFFTAHRYDVDWGALDYLSRAGKLKVPILVFHRREDDRVPIKTSQRLAELRPDAVTLVEVDGPGHVRAWNADPGAYAAAIKAFIGAKLER